VIAGVRRCWVLCCVAVYPHTLLTKYSRGILPLVQPYTAESPSQILLWSKTFNQQLSPCFQPIVYLEAVCPALEVNFYRSFVESLRKSAATIHFPSESDSGSVLRSLTSTRALSRVIPFLLSLV
jgi:hypothetical protein